MKRAVTFRISFALLLAGVLIINGCKKETTVKNIAPVTVNSESVDSANYLKGYFDGAPIAFEGNATAYHAFVDPDSANGGGGGGNPGQSHDNDAFYQSGSKWMNLNNAGIMSVNASLELRSLAVRVFVSPIANVNTTYFNLLSPTAYPVSSGQVGSAGAFITLHDKNGVMWTTHGDQDESTFVILTRGANLNSFTVITGTVSCKLYDGEGNMKKLTAAQFTAEVGI